MENSKVELCKVKDLIEKLQQYNPEANIVIGEMNAFDGGFWQHIFKDMIDFAVRSVAEEKENIKNDTRTSEENKKKYLEKDFIYVKDDDVIVRL